MAPLLSVFFALPETFRKKKEANECERLRESSAPDKYIGKSSTAALLHIPSLELPM